MLIDFVDTFLELTLTKFNMNRSEAKTLVKKIAKKQTAQDIYIQQQREQGFDPFELD